MLVEPVTNKKYKAYRRSHGHYISFTPHKRPPCLLNHPTHSTPSFHLPHGTKETKFHSNHSHYSI
ncbi:hypothetical protein E2C01_020757 [Portunus trituberculatus]|uniref:Uncharacterized protein n=1 Tax=Portunus trituberculatus TaxID=210409 RepID=A0A5B7E2Y6_PORTR|nr:hypothetical protein [Portunus trituberculatus]